MLPAAGVKLVEIDLHADGSLDLDGLDAALAAGARALVLASPHNPTGRALDARANSRRSPSAAPSASVWVLADEIHAPLTLPGATSHPWLEVSDAARRWGVAVTSASKAFNLGGAQDRRSSSPPIRPPATSSTGMPPLHEHSGLLGVIAAEAAFDDGDAWLDAVIEQLDANRDAARRPDLPAAAPGRSRWRPPQATYLAWLDCTGLGLGDEPADGLPATRPGRRSAAASTTAPPGAGHVRLNFATSPAHLSDAVARMARTVARA